MQTVERCKLRMKIGVHEFEADGPRDVVLAHLDTWMRAAGLRPAGTGATDAPAPGRLFGVDAARQLVTLRVRIDGRRRNADAALLLLHGFETCLGDGNATGVAATRLREAMSASGYRLQRLDRTLAPYVTAGLVQKAGRHKHESYSLTESGGRRAVALAHRVGSGGNPRGNSQITS